jgi:hypothetical protein
VIGAESEVAALSEFVLGPLFGDTGFNEDLDMLERSDGVRFRVDVGVDDDVEELTAGVKARGGLPNG